MAQIGLFFGSFNPVHLGHTRLADHIRQHCGLDEVWLVVSPNNPLKERSGLLDAEIRYRLVEMATEEIEGLRASDCEFALPMPNYTIVTLHTLSSNYPEDTFHLIMGSDNLAIFDHWRQYEDILREYPIIVYPRPGDDMEALLVRYPSVRVVENAPLFPISATEIRAKISCGGCCDEWLHPAVADFLKKNAFLFANINK